MVKDAAKNFVDKFAGSKTKMAVIQYSDSANDNDLKSMICLCLIKELL